MEALLTPAVAHLVVWEGCVELLCLPTIMRRKVPTRLRSLADSRWQSELIKILFFFLLGLMPIGIGFLVGLTNQSLLQAIPYVLVGLTPCGYGIYLWIGIPRRVFLRSVKQARNFFEGRRFVLVLWSFQDYDDIVKRESIGQTEFGDEVFKEYSLDSELLTMSKEKGVDVVRLWNLDLDDLVGDERKGIQAICVDEIWLKTIEIALQSAKLVIFFEGGGDGLRLERGIIDCNETLIEKTLFLHSGEGAVAELAAHFDTVVDWRG